MKRGDKTDNSTAEVIKDIFAVSKGARANERKEKDQFDYLRKDDWHLPTEARNIIS